MPSDIEIQKFLLSPPGDTIQDHINFIGMSQAELAERMGRPKEKINDLIRGRDALTTATAYQLEKVLGIPASFWMNREKSYRKELYEIEQQEAFEKQKEWLRAFPIKELKKLGFLPETKEKHVLVDSLLKFYCVASVEEWEKIYLKNKVTVAFKVSLAHTKSPHAISAWLRMGEIQSKEIALAPFDKKKFRASLYEIKELAFKRPNDFATKLKDICAKSGIALVFTKNLPKAPISGATRWFQNKPIIQLAGKFAKNDHFWFTFFHEAAHILLHGKKEVFLEEVDGTRFDQEKETEANQYAFRIILPEAQVQEIVNDFPLNEKKILKYSKKFRVPEGILIGRLQQLKHIPNSFGNVHRQQIDLFN